MVGYPKGLPNGTQTYTETLRRKMNITQSLTFQENFRCRTWATYTFPAGTSTKDIIGKLQPWQRDNKLQTALRGKRHRYQEWEIIPEIPEMAYV
jgi:hypothetical protein